MNIANIQHLLTVAFELAVVLGIMVLVHETGHFLVAKLCGVRVETFSIGFGKRILGFKRGDTDYRLSILPLGGYVKMSGDNPGEAPSGDPGEFNAHPRWQRVAIALAGPVSNFILAFCLMLFVGMVHYEVETYLHQPSVADYVPLNSATAKAGLQSGDTIVHFNDVENPDWNEITSRSAMSANQTVAFSFLHNGVRTDTKLLIDAPGGPKSVDFAHIGLIPRVQTEPIGVQQVSPNTPAEHAGIHNGDQIATIDGIPTHSVHSLLAYMHDQGGKPAVLTVIRNGQPMQVPITPEVGDIGAGDKDYRLGFLPTPTPVDVVKLPFAQAVKASYQTNKDDSALILEVIHRMFTRKVSVRSLSGPIGIAQQIDMSARIGLWGPVGLLHLMASISLNLGIFNLLPIPILDGGMILFLLIESLMRRDMNQQLKERIYQVAFVCILLFAVFVIFNDISQLSPFAKGKP